MSLDSNKFSYSLMLIINKASEMIEILNMGKILITGGLGYIGSHTCLLFLEKGFEVIAYDLLLNSEIRTFHEIKALIGEINPKLVDNFSFVEGDIRDFKLLSEVFLRNRLEGSEIQGVIHFAGLKSVERSVEDPLLYWDFNVKGTINLLKVMENNNCKKIVFSSSATVYGESNNNLLDEQTALNPKNPYGDSKLAIEKILKNLSSNHDNWKVGILRYFNPAGAHESGKLGESTKFKSENLFPKICDVAAKKIEKIFIYGKFWPTKDGTCVRDYIHVMDLAEAHLSAYKFLTLDENFFILNVGSGIGTSVLELIRIFENTNDCNIPIEFVEKRPGDVSRLVADNKLIIEKLNWRAKRNIHEICKSGWSFYKKSSNAI